MKKTLLLFLSFFWMAFHLLAQTPSQDLSVMLRAEVQATPAQIRIIWPADATATAFKVNRKTLSATSWGGFVATLPGTDTAYTDNSVSAGTLYEYRIQRTTPSGTTYGYIVSGIETELAYNKGYLVLVVDSFFTTDLAPEISQLIKDYEGDGWFVKRMDVSRSAAVADVKAQIKTLYDESPTDTRSVMLLGHVPVPYSGVINPDGHPDHLGAWPADVFYGEMTSTWTDATANETSATSSRNHNVPGDGKYDFDILPSEIEMEVARVDFYNLPAFSDSETELMRKYLVKLHAFKTRGFIPTDRALIEDNFVGMSEGFAATGFMNHAPMVGSSQITQGDYTTDLQSGSYLCSYGTGPGSYNNAAGIVSTNDCAADSLQTVFTFLFGSYFGDWDTPNNLLRSALGSGTVLTNAWAGRPHWHIHQMGMGQHIGFSAKLTQNNSGLYFGSTLPYFNRWIHIALMGDPALRLHYVAPPASISSSIMSMGYPIISWTASPEVVTGYHVFRREISENYWERITPATPVTVTNLADMSVADNGTYVYMVRAVRLHTTPSGTYYNMSLGLMDTISTTVGISENSPARFAVYPNPVESTLQLSFASDISHKTLCITNAIGETVSTQNINQAAGSIITLDVSGLTKGIYFVTLDGFTQKIIKT